MHSIDTSLEVPHTDPSRDNAKPVVVKRDKSTGEKLFDIGTYGGMAMGANEAISTVIMRSAKEGALKTPYEKFVGAVSRTPLLKRSSYVHTGRLGFLLFATIGGMLTVFPVKFMEDHKGSLVRWINQKIRGSAVNDPQLEQEQREMDAAPRQSWGSLWKGRVTTVFSAVGMDFMIGHSDSVSAKLLENTRFKNYGSLQRGASTLARKIVDHFDPAGKAERFAARDAAKPYEIQAGEGKWVGRGETAGFLMTLSLTLTIMFYVSSKMFATHRAVKQEKKREEEGIPSPNAGVVYQADHGIEHAVLHADHAPSANDNVVTANDNDVVHAHGLHHAQPSHHVHAVHNHGVTSHAHVEARSQA